MKVVHLTDSPFFGGPERQILGLATSLPGSIRTTVLCFSDHASSLPFLEQLAEAGVPARMLGHANPKFLHMIADIRAELRAEGADLLVCHGYKANMLGWVAGRMVGIPIVSVSRGWTGHTRKVRLYENLDRRMLRLMDRVICVSEGQAEKVRKAGVKSDHVRVIRNAINGARFERLADNGRQLLQGLFSNTPETIVIGVGRLSKEKGFDQLVETASLVVQRRPRTGFVLIGDGPERANLEARVRALGLQQSIAFTGFRKDIDRLIAGADLLAQSSYTEGMPNVVLEAGAAGVAVVATDVGGTREVVRDGITGYLVPPGDARALAVKLLALLASPSERRVMGAMGHALVCREFSFPQQAVEYETLFREMSNQRSRALDGSDVDGSDVDGSDIEIAAAQQRRRLSAERERVEPARPRRWSRPAHPRTRLRILIITEDDPLYVRQFFRVFFDMCERENFEICAVTIAKPFHEAIWKTGRRMWRFFGPIDFVRLLTRFVGAKIRGESIQSLAEERRIPVLPTTSVNDPLYVDRVRSLVPDVIVSVAAPEIFRKDILSAAKLRCINIHSGRLPKYRGMMPAFWQMLHGEERATITVHDMAERLDAGAVLGVSEFGLRQRDSLDRVIVGTKLAGAKLMINVLRQIADGTVKPRPLDMASAGYFSFPTSAHVRAFRSKGHRLL